MNIQIGEMATGDFQEKTITFEMETPMVLQAGTYAIISIRKDLSNDEIEDMTTEFKRFLESL